MKKDRPLLSLFLSFLKIGAFTFGGGYAMIALLRNEFVDNKKWIDREEFTDVVAIAESTPGPIAINAATYIGYRVGGFSGALLSTVAVCLPSFVILYLISLFFDRFLSLRAVSCAFQGIRAGIAYLILSAGLRMIREMKKDAVSVILLSLTVAAMIGFSLFAVDFSSIFYILIAGTVGVVLWLIRRAKNGKEEKSK